jgi:UDP-glucose 4-epimerase
MTGAAGYVGSACLRWLLKHGHDPVAYDNMLEGNAKAVPNGRLIVGDLLDPMQIRDALRQTKAEAVMHFAALASVPESIKEPERYWRVNVVGTKNLLDAMLDCGVTKMMFSSTAATYSFKVDMPITETSEQKPETPYGTTKLACENMIKEYARAYGLSYGILRYFNASGADPDGNFGECRHVEGHLIPLILYAATGRRPSVKIFGTDWPTPDGTCIRDYIHTDDLAQAHQLVLEALKPGYGEAFNCGSGSGASILEVLRACEKAVGKPIPHEFAPRRPGDPAVLIASSDKLKKQLGWKPQFPTIQQIVDTAWKWHSTHPYGFKG